VRGARASASTIASRDVSSSSASEFMRSTGFAAEPADTRPPALLSFAPLALSSSRLRVLEHGRRRPSPCARGVQPGTRTAGERCPRPLSRRRRSPTGQPPSGMGGELEWPRAGAIRIGSVLVIVNSQTYQLGRGAGGKRLSGWEKTARCLVASGRPRNTWATTLGVSRTVRMCASYYS
jgi:hypothetical protein